MSKTYTNLEYLGTSASDTTTTSYEKTQEITTSNATITASNAHAQLPLAVGNYFLMTVFDISCAQTINSVHLWCGMGASGEMKYLTHTVDEYTGGVRNDIVLSSVIKMTSEANCAFMIGVDSINGETPITLNFKIKRLALVKISDDMTYESDFSALKSAIIEKQATAYTIEDYESGNKFVAVSRKNFDKALKRIEKLETGGIESANRLNGKKIIFEGDSICAAREQNGYGYAKLIADITGCTYDNQAVAGASVSAIGSNSDSGSYTFPHSVVENSSKLPTDGHIYCFQGGINDYYHNVPLGTFDELDFSYTPNTKTVYGAMEQLCKNAMYYYAGKPVCYILTHKCYNTLTKNSAGYTAKELHDAQVKVLRKYGIPYYDAFEESGLNGCLNIHKNNYMNGGLSGNPDGVHPNEEGYLIYYVPQIIALFNRIMPY